MAQKIKAEHAEKLLAANAANVLKNAYRKLQEGKSLNAQELATIRANQEGGDGAEATAWAKNQVELARALGVDRKTIQRWIKLKRGGPPEAMSDGRYSVNEWKAWCKRTGRGGGVDGDEEVGEIERLTAKGLILRNRRLELDIAEREGELINRAEVVRDVTQAIVAFKRELYRMAGTISPQIVGLPIPEAERLLRASIDDALQQISNGEWAQSQEEEESEEEEEDNGES